MNRLPPVSTGPVATGRPAPEAGLSVRPRRPRGLVPDMGRPRGLVPEMGRPLGLVPEMGGRLGLVLLMGALALSACAGPSQQGGQAQADAETRAACQARAEQAYNQRNRAEIYGPQSQVNTPYSANYVPSMSDRGLSDLFAHDRMVSDCIRNTGTSSDRDQPASSPSPAPATPARPPSRRASPPSLIAPPPPPPQ
jgi:hypothetical protein